VSAATAPGPPGADFGDGAPLAFLIRRAAGSGRWAHLVTWAPGGAQVTEQEDRIEVRHGDAMVVVEATGHGIAVRAPGEPPVRLPAREARRAASQPAVLAAGPPECAVPLWPERAEPFSGDSPAAEWELGEESYRQSERSHAERGGTRAAVSVAAQGDALLVRVRVIKSGIVTRAADAPDPALDNEPADIHSDGVQVYVDRDRWMGVLAVPELEAGTVRVRPVAGTASFPAAVTGSCRRTAEGYEVLLRLPTGRAWRVGDPLRFTVTVNEMVPGRERRSGQLALAGGGWVWLRGDRESPHQAVTAEIA
jgi:hypothetical protein